MECIKIGACTKLNLSLNVTAKRNDGYHLISSVFQSIDLKNYLYIQKDSGFSFECNDLLLPTDEKNTAVKAVKLFCEKAGITPNIKMKLEKRVPYGAGMGSASADASAALYGMNLLFPNKIDINELFKTALKVGADVPFSLQGGTALVEGIGEKIKPLAFLPDCYFLIVVPKYKNATALAYFELDKKNDRTSIDNQKLIKAIESRNIRNIAENIGNTFFDILHVEENLFIKSRLLELGALNATLTGSGSAVYGIFENYEAVKAAEGKFENCFIAKPSKKALYIE